MTVILIVAATVILLALILWRGRSPEFRQESEYPKFRFLENLGIPTSRSAAAPAGTNEQAQIPIPNLQEKPNND